MVCITMPCSPVIWSFKKNVYEYWFDMIGIIHPCASPEKRAKCVAQKLLHPSVCHMLDSGWNLPFFFVCYTSQLFIYIFSVDLVQCDLFHVHRLINDAHHHHRAYVCECVCIFTSDKYGCLGIITNKLSFSQMIKQKKTRLCWRHRTL